jgi:hypothetical protein
MDEAAQSFVDMTELNIAAGKVVARACGAEAGLVTAGASAAQVLMVAACMTGTDPARIASLQQAILRKIAASRDPDDTGVVWVGGDTTTVIEGNVHL